MHRIHKYRTVTVWKRGGKAKESEEGEGKIPYANPFSGKAKGRAVKWSKRLFFFILLAGFGAELGLSWRGCKGMNEWWILFAPPEAREVQEAGVSVVRMVLFKL